MKISKNHANKIRWNITVPALNLLKHIQDMIFFHLHRRKFEVISVVKIQKGSLCSIQELDLSNDSPTDDVIEERESHANMALLMFYPCRQKSDILLEGSYWKSVIVKE